MKFISITPEKNNTAEFVEATNNMPSFVKLYSPGCGHCVAMQGSWDALKDHAALKDYDMAIIEVHADELDKINSPAMSVNGGFPTIRKVLKNGNLGKDYEGNRSTEDMVKFIKDNFPDTLTNDNSKSKRSKSKRSKSKRSKSKSKRSKSKRRHQSNMKGGGKRRSRKSRKTLRRKRSRKSTKRKYIQ